MNSANQETIILTTDASQYTIAPGGILKIPMTLSNQGNTPDQVRISVEGIPLVWVSAEQQVVLLQPGQQARMSLTIQPPESPSATIGRYILVLQVISLINPEQATQTRIHLTVAGYEVKGRIGVLLAGVQYAVVPGDPLAIPVVRINQGLVADTFRMAVEGLPDGWVSIPDPVFRLEPGESSEATLTIKPPRLPDSNAGRHPFRIRVESQEAPDQGAGVDCTLTVMAFTEFEASLEAAQPDQNLPAKVSIRNLSNIPESFQVSWASPEGSLVFTPDQPQQVNIPAGEEAGLDYSTRPARRPLFGGEKGYPYSVDVKASNQHSQSLEGSLTTKGLLPTWVLIAGVVVLVLACLYLGWASGLTGSFSNLRATPTLSGLEATATQSQTDQRPLLIERKWYLVAYNNTSSSPGAQEAFVLFNPNNTLIGFTGCKDLSGSYQTNFNQISITNVSLGSGACPESALQQQEDALMAILRSARSYYVADTVLQIAGEAGFLNFSLSPLNRTEEIAPPQAVIRVVPQSQVGQVVIYDGSTSTGQVPLVAWRWEFGDGNTASGTIVQHIYTSASTFTVRLTVTDQRGQTGTTTAQIHILPLPTLSPTPTALPPTPTPVPPTQPPSQPTYTPAPTPEPPTATPEPPPAPVPPVANIAGPGQGFIGEPVRFDASASQPGSSAITSYSWSLGNGVNLPVSTEASTTATYNRAGNYEVTVFVSDANGLSSFATTRIQINARLDTSVWTLSRLNNRPLLPGTAITLQFKNGEIAGFAGCNTYNGRYTADLNDDGTYTITVGPLTTSRLACPQDIMNQEQAYLASLQGATRATVQENRIILDSPSGNLEFYLIDE